jgi:uncharacterized membrane protein YuzA (DUF378 family)
MPLPYKYNKFLFYRCSYILAGLAGLLVLLNLGLAGLYKLLLLSILTGMPDQDPAL